MDYEMVLADLLHEVRKFNESIKASCEELGKALKSNKTADIDQARHYSSRIHVSTQEISMRLEFVAAQLNPEALKDHGIVASTIYGKFLKVSKMLAPDVSRKHINLRLDGINRRAVDLYYIFDIVPFVLLDNAMKYSPAHSDVSVTFTESKSRLEVLVGSVGPLVSAGEITKVFERGFRGEWARKTEVPGQGIGLHFAKWICDLHGFNIDVESDRSMFSMGSVPYAGFKVSLIVPW